MVGSIDEVKNSSFEKILEPEFTQAVPSEHSETRRQLTLAVYMLLNSLPSSALFPDSLISSLDLNLNSIVTLFAQGMQWPYAHFLDSWIGILILINFLVLLFICHIGNLTVSFSSYLQGCAQIIYLNSLFWMLDFIKILGISL